MRKVNNIVIIWSIDDFNTLGLIRQLGNKGLNLLFLIKGSVNFAAKSKYCEKYIETKTVEEGYKYLLDNFKTEKYKPIIIVACDEIITYIDQHKNELQKYFIIPGTSRKGDIEKYIDKNRMTALAKKVGILCPMSKYISKSVFPKDIKYPCLIKPSHEKPGHYNEFKFKICKNEFILRHILKYVRNDSEFILQEYIPKKLDLLIYGVRMLDRNIIIAGTFIRDRWADSGSSSHGYITEEIPAYIDLEKVKKFIEEIDYFGLFSVEYGILDNRAYFFEINLRNDGTSHYFYQAGANLPLAYVYNCAGLDYSDISTKVNGKKWFIDEIFDIENVILGKLKIKKWKKEISEATIYKYFDREDIIPFNIVRKRRVKQMFQDIILKRFRVYIVFIMDKLGMGK